ncbi:MAG: SDR family oxidoreductase [Candidatus Hodarchaeales archaeon]|jgi:NAD(P)-dependent dehydrogenase (short-subunit alcohol dehydrogenase family)
MEPLLNMDGKTCMVTGANAGIGFETVLSLARLGANVIMVCRNQERGETALHSLKTLSHSESIELFLADLSDFQSIRSMVDLFTSKHDSLHVLVNNAGIWLRHRQITVNGHESTFATNHLGHFLLTTLLVDVMKTSAPARIINVSALLYHFGKINFDDINMEKKYNGFRAYCNSKLANILFTYHLAKKLEGEGMTVNTLHPGVILTNLGKLNRDDTSRKSGRGFFSRLFMTTPEKGARTQIYLATSPEVENVTGKYFRNCKVKKTSKKTHSEALQLALWETSEEMVNLTNNEFIN